MSKQLNLSELIALARDTDDHSLKLMALRLERDTERRATSLAKAIAKHLGVKAGTMTNEGPDFAGFCVPFFANAIGQACPEVLRQYDVTEWSVDIHTDLDPKTGKEV